MSRLLVLLVFALATNADVLPPFRSRGATLVREVLSKSVSFEEMSYSSPNSKHEYNGSERPISTCCDMPELGDAKPLSDCSNSKLPNSMLRKDELSTLRSQGRNLISSESNEVKPIIDSSLSKLPTPCREVQCVFEKSGFLTDKQTLNKEAYKAHLRKWLEGHKEWTDAIEKAIRDCIDKDVRQYLDEPCKAYDVFTCTGMAMLKKCPDAAWKC